MIESTKDNNPDNLVIKFEYGRKFKTPYIKPIKIAISAIARDQE